MTVSAFATSLESVLSPHSHPRPPVELDGLLPRLLGSALLPVLHHEPPAVRASLPAVASRVRAHCGLGAQLRAFGDGKLPDLDPWPVNAPQAVDVR